MTRLTLAALAKLARTASATDKATLTITTHPQSGDRYACWPYGCTLLPPGLIEDLMWPADGPYALVKGQLTPCEMKGFSVPFVVERMLPLLDTTPRRRVEPNGWLHERFPLTLRYLANPENADAPELVVAVNDDLWQAWTKHATGPVWHPNHAFLLWAADDTSRATALLGTIHRTFAPTIPDLPTEAS